MGLTEREIRDRIRRQIPKYIQRQRADFVLINNGAKQDLTAAAGHLFVRLLSMAESD
jgi:dephospho-CoA kinase